MRSDTEVLLHSGGDSRLDVDPTTGSNRYGSSYQPVEDLLALGSCTSSTITPGGFAAAEAALRHVTHGPASERPERLAELLEAARAEIARLLVPDSPDAVDVILTPSGTDAEYVALLIAAGAADGRVLNVMIAPGEIGSGSVPAAGGLHFDRTSPSGDPVAVGTPVDDALADRVDVAEVAVRAASGAVRDPAEIDREVEEIVDRAVASGRVVLLHVVAHSKTGAHAPTPDLVSVLSERHGDRVSVVVDAAQGRISRRGLAARLALGHLVILTGSKYYGGPPFSGAVLVPRSVSPPDSPPAAFGRYFLAGQAPAGWAAWRSGLPQREDLGLVLRWTAALHEIEAYYRADPGQRFAVLRAFEQEVPQVLGAQPGLVLQDDRLELADEVDRVLESKRTVFSFELSDGQGIALDATRLSGVQRALRMPAGGRRPIQIGQPVLLGTEGRSALRVALGAPLVTEYSRRIDPRAAIREDLMVTRDAIAEAVSSGVRP